MGAEDAGVATEAREGWRCLLPLTSHDLLVEYGWVQRRRITLNGSDEGADQLLLATTSQCPVPLDYALSGICGIAISSGQANAETRLTSCVLFPTASNGQSCMTDV